MDGGHFAVHGEGRVGEMSSSSHCFERRESGGAGGDGEGEILLLRLQLLFLILLMLLLQRRERRTIEGAGSDATSLESTTVEAGTVVVVALADDFAAADDDAAVAVVEGRLGGLLEAESEVIIGLHCDVES